jgi:hypothetical protein
MDLVEVGKIFGTWPIMFNPFSGGFDCDIGGVKFFDQNYNILIRKIKSSPVLVINEKVYYKECSGYEQKTVVRLEAWKEYFYDENGRQQSLKDIVPMTKKNRDAFNKAKELKDKGWGMIRAADNYLAQNLEQFPDNYWVETQERILKEWNKNAS